MKNFLQDTKGLFFSEDQSFLVFRTNIFPTPTGVFDHEIFPKNSSRCVKSIIISQS
jgi:hypothetical protein